MEQSWITRSVVVSDIEPYTIIDEISAKPIMKRFNQKLIDLLQRIEWWNWSAEKIIYKLKLLTSNDNILQLLPMNYMVVSFKQWFL